MLCTLSVDGWVLCQGPDQRRPGEVHSDGYYLEWHGVFHQLGRGLFLHLHLGLHLRHHCCELTVGMYVRHT